MKYEDLFITDKNKIEKNIQLSYAAFHPTETNAEIDSTIIVTVNKIITKEFMFPSYDDNVTEIIDEQCCIPFLPYLSCFYRNKSTVVRVIYPHTKPQKMCDNYEQRQLIMRNLLLFLQGLSLEDIIMIAKYHNLYYKNTIFKRVLLKQKMVNERSSQQLTSEMTTRVETPKGGSLSEGHRRSLGEEQHLTLINWVYDHICIYLYNQNI